MIMDLLAKTSLILVYLLFYYTNVDAQCGSSSTYSTTASTTTFKSIKSKNYPSPYDNYISCTATISTTGTGGQILFHVISQRIERRYDLLKLYTGSISTSNLLHNSDRNSAGAVGVTDVGERLIVKFTTDSSIVYGGYKLEFLQVENLRNCGESITATSTEQQLSYVSSWHASSPCVWTLSAQNPTDAVKIEVVFVDGYIRIIEGTVETSLSTTGSTYVSGQHDLTIQIVGYSSNDFVLTYKSTSTGSAGAVTAATVTTSTIDANSVCYERSKTAISTKRSLNSPDYPGSYPNNINCLVTIMADNPSDSVSLDILDYALQTSDQLKIYDGIDTSYDEIPVSTASDIVSSGASISVQFVTNSYGQNRGFNLTYSSVVRFVPTCTVTLQASYTADTTQQTLTSPSYPGYYNNDLDLYWLITKPTVSSQIVLDFREFKLETNLDCSFDYVAIYDGSCTDNALLSKICGEDAVTFEEPTGLYILIHFHTDSSVVNTGWSLTYYIGAFQDPDVDESTDESKSGVPDFVYPIIGIAVFMLIAVVTAVYIFHESFKRRVGDGEGKAKVKRRTVSNLMHEIKVNVSTKTMKPTKKTVTIKHRDPVPPPPQNLPPLLHDPVYPPIDYRNTGSQMPARNVVPVIPQGGSFQPSAPIQPNASGSMIPPPYSYMTPSDARNAGIYG